MYSSEEGHASRWDVYVLLSLERELQSRFRSHAVTSLVGISANFLSVLQLAVPSLSSALAHERRVVITRHRSQQEDPARYMFARLWHKTFHHDDHHYS